MERRRWSRIRTIADTDVAIQEMFAPDWMSKKLHSRTEADENKSNNDYLIIESRTRKRELIRMMSNPEFTI